MATVYLARATGHAGFERLVAIKCCHPHLRGDEEFVSMFLDEARLAAKIHHPHVVATLDASEPDSRTLYLVMEFVDGYSLWQLLRAAGKQKTRLPIAVVTRVVADTLFGLHAAHELRDKGGAPINIVHRDVSPHNVLVGLDGLARIMDFGIAKAESRLSHTREGLLKGKLGYMAPEQHGIGTPPVKAEVTRLADVYAAGVVLWESLTGRKLFHGESDSATVKRLVESNIVKPSLYAPAIPPELDAVVLRALARDPSDRYESALEFAEAIEASGAALASRREVGAMVRALVPQNVSAREALLKAIAETDRVHHPDSIAPRVDAPSKSVTRTAGSIGIDAPPVAVAPAPPSTRHRSRAVSWVIGVMALAAALIGIHVLRSRAIEASLERAERGVIAARTNAEPSNAFAPIANHAESPVAEAPLHPVVTPRTPVLIPAPASVARRAHVVRVRRTRREYRPATL
jgi:serine/threonine-protein kinase